MLKQMIRCIYLLGALVLTPQSVWAQAQGSSADLTGTIYDPTKATVTEAIVTAVNLDTMMTRSTTSDLNGVYRISLLPPGAYEVKVRAVGFNQQVKRGITLTVGQTAVINFDLLIGVKMETEVIETAAPLIELERTYQSSTITQRPISNLPINGRNFMEFIKLTPGVVEESPTVTRVLLPRLPTSGLSFAGQNGRSNSVQIDGVSNNDIAGNGVRPTISQEAVREFQVNSAGYNAEFGRASAGTINIVSKSGSNQFHGNVYNYLRNELLDARNTFAPASSQDPPFKRNQPGFSLGGPLQRDKTFFFVSSEGLFRRESAYTSILADPSILNPTPGQQDLINTLIGMGDATRAMLGQQLQSLLTTSPNSPPPSAGPPFQQNLATYNFLTGSHGTFPVWESSSTSSLRIDHAFSERDYLFFRYGYTNDAQHNIGIGGLFGPSSGYDIAVIDNGVVLGENHLFRNGDSNEFRFQFSRNIYNAHTVDPFGPRYNLAGIGTFGRDFLAPVDRNQLRGQFVDNFSLKRGRNNIKFGGDFSRYKFDVFNPAFGGGQLDFAPSPMITLQNILGPAVSNNLIAALQRPVRAGGLGRPDLVPVINAQPLTTVQMLNFGLPNTITQGYGNPNATFTGQTLGLYAQNGIQLKSNLYLNLGLRYDYELQPTGTIRDRNNFGPRISFSYSPFKSGKTVIRGGSGLYYQSLYAATALVSSILGTGQISNILVSANSGVTPAAPNSPCGMENVPPSSCFYQQLVSAGLVGFSSNATIPEAAYANLLGLTSQDGTNRFVTRLDPRIVNPYSIQGNFGIDHQLGRDWFVSVNYLVNHGVKLNRTRQVNAVPSLMDVDAFGRPALTGRIDPTRVADFVFETSGNSIYHGLAVSMNKRFSSYYQLIGSYTFSKAIDDVTDISFEQGPQDPTNVRADRSLSTFNASHRLSLTSLFESPFRGGAGKSLYERVLANFYLSPIVTVRSGFPFNVVTGFDVNMDNVINDRPFGVGRNTGLGPGFFSTDLRMGRRFPLGADSPRSIEAIFDTFNLFNRVNYREVNSNTGGMLYLDQLGYSDVRVTGCSDRPANSFCGFTSSFDPRIIQLGVKVSF